MDWQPIETCPKDGTLVLLLMPNDMPHPTEENERWRTIGMNSRDLTGEDYWQFCGWDWCHDVFMNLDTLPASNAEPTHWYPLPGLPWLPPLP